MHGHDAYRPHCTSSPTHGHDSYHPHCASVPPHGHDSHHHTVRGDSGGLCGGARRSQVVLVTGVVLALAKGALGGGHARVRMARGTAAGSPANLPGP